MSTEHDKLISVKDAAKECGRNPETVRRWIWSGKLPAEKLGNQLFVRRKALESFCKEIGAALEATDQTETVAGSVPNVADMDAQNRAIAIEQARAASGLSFVREPTATFTARNRASTITRMRKLREEVRSRVGNLDIDTSMEQTRRERADDLTSMR